MVADTHGSSDVHFKPSLSLRHASFALPWLKASSEILTRSLASSSSLLVQTDRASASESPPPSEKDEADSTRAAVVATREAAVTREESLRMDAVCTRPRERKKEEKALPNQTDADTHASVRLRKPSNAQRGRGHHHGEAAAKRTPTIEERNSEATPHQDLTDGSQLAASTAPRRTTTTKQKRIAELITQDMRSAVPSRVVEMIPPQNGRPSLNSRPRIEAWNPTESFSDEDCYSDDAHFTTSAALSRVASHSAHAHNQQSSQAHVAPHGIRSRPAEHRGSLIHQSSNHQPMPYPPRRMPEQQPQTIHYLPFAESSDNLPQKLQFGQFGHTVELQPSLSLPHDYPFQPLHSHQSLIPVRPQLDPQCSSHQQKEQQSFPVPGYYHDYQQLQHQKRQLEAYVLHLQATLTAEQFKARSEKLGQGQGQIIINNTTEVLASSANSSAVSIEQNSVSGQRGDRWLEVLSSRAMQCMILCCSIFALHLLRRRMQHAWRVQHMQVRADVSPLFRLSRLINKSVEAVALFGRTLSPIEPTATASSGWSIWRAGLWSLMGC